MVVCLWTSSVAALIWQPSPVPSIPDELHCGSAYVKLLCSLDGGLLALKGTYLAHLRFRQFRSIVSFASVVRASLDAIHLVLRNSGPSQMVGVHTCSGDTTWTVRSMKRMKLS